MNEVEQAYAKMCSGWHTPQPTWNELHPAAQQHFISLINAVIQFMNMPKKTDPNEFL